MRNLVSFVVGGVIAAGILWLLKPAEEELIPWYRLSDEGIVERMEDASLSEVHQYVDWIHSEELPRNYIIPAHVANARGVRAAQASVDQRYPQFQNVFNDDLLRAVRQNPLLYKDYIRETLSIRKRFATNQK